MRTTKKEFKEQVQKHVLESLSEEHGTTTKDQLQSVVEGFKNWWGPYEQKRNPSKYGAFKDWTMCLPSEINVEYRHYAMEDNVKSWFNACGEEYKEPKDESKTHDMYLHLVTREFDTLCKKNNIKF
jgi:hypothetical protein